MPHPDGAPDPEHGGLVIAGSGLACLQALPQLTSLDLSGAGVHIDDAEFFMQVSSQPRQAVHFFMNTVLKARIVQVQGTQMGGLSTPFHSPMLAHRHPPASLTYPVPCPALLPPPPPASLSLPHSRASVS